MSKTNTSQTKLCPTCGTKMPENSPRCLVCGTNFESGQTRGTASHTQPQPKIQGSKMPTVTLSVPVILILFVVFLLVGIGLTFGTMQITGFDAEATVLLTDTPTATQTITPTPAPPTLTNTPLPSPTPLTYIVQDMDSCYGIAGFFGIGVESIILLNNLGTNCTLSVGQQLLIPHATPTQTPLATSTLSNEQLTVEACPREYYTVLEGDTLSFIASVRGIPVEAIIQWSGKVDDTVFAGEVLTLPLCARTETFGVGTSTPTVAPPYPAPSLLLPRNGEFFTASSEIVTLNWASVGTLRNNEFYRVVVADLTLDRLVQIVDYVRETSFTVPTELRPTDGSTHIYEWFVVSVAQIGVNEDGSPIYIEGGAISETFYFSWTGTLEESPGP